MIGDPGLAPWRDRMNQPNRSLLLKMQVGHAGILPCRAFSKRHLECYLHDPRCV
jgi:hypothetical protein